MNMQDDDQRTRNSDTELPENDTENSGQGEKKGGDFGQAGNPGTANETFSDNSESGTATENNTTAPAGDETENSGQGEKHGGAFGQASQQGTGVDRDMEENSGSNENSNRVNAANGKVSND